jgi:mRNA-degrading endonuclease RelE of RelBE toxin-antitoxin system
MNFIYTERFKKFYKRLSDEEKNVLQKKLLLMKKNPSHPSLRTKKVQGTGKIFESSIMMAVRLTWQYEGESIMLRVVGDHDEVLGNP